MDLILSPKFKYKGLDVMFSIKLLAAAHRSTKSVMEPKQKPKSLMNQDLWSKFVEQIQCGKRSSLVIRNWYSSAIGVVHPQFAVVCRSDCSETLNQSVSNVAPMWLLITMMLLFFIECCCCLQTKRLNGLKQNVVIRKISWKSAEQDTQMPSAPKNATNAFH